MRRIALLLAVAMVAAGLLSASASAADRTIALSAGHTTEKWSGTGAFGATPGGVYECRMGGMYNCDDTLVDLEDAGTLTASGSTDGDWIMNMLVYKAAADGSPEGEPIADGELGAQFSVSAKDLVPGQYLLRIVFRLAVDASFDAETILKPDAPPADALPPVAAPPPPVQTTSPARTAPAAKKPSCKAKARKIKKAKKRKAALKRCRKRKR